MSLSSPWRWAAAAALALCLTGPPVRAQAPQPEGPLPEEVLTAQREARTILSMPVFRDRAPYATQFQRIGRTLTRWGRAVLDAISRLVQTKYGTTISTTVSILVIAGTVALLGWLLTRTRRGPAGSDLPGPGGREGAATRPSPSLEEAEGAIGRGAWPEAAALLVAWFLARAFDPERPPDWKTNRELLPEIRGRGPLSPKDWDSLVAVHEALRYARATPDPAILSAWLARAKGVQP